MTKLNISPIEIKFADYSYSVKEIVDVILKDKLDEDVKNFSKTGLNIERVYKSYDLNKIDFKNTIYSPPDIKLNDMFVEVAKKLLRRINKDSNEIGFLTTISDYHQYQSPSPTIEIVDRLGMNKYIRTQNLQGLACSSFPEALRNAAGHFALGYEGDVLILSGAYYIPWFLDSFKQIDLVSMKNKKDFHNFIYFLILSDVTSAVLISKENDTDKSIAQIDTNTIFSRKDNSPNGYRNQTIVLSPHETYRLTFDMNVNTKLLQENIGNFSWDNISRLKENFPNYFEKVKAWGFHTAGAKYIDDVRKKCGINEESSKLTYDLLSETGNTGSVSSLQFIKESIERKILNKGEIGGFIDFGWEGADAFIYKML